MAIASKHHSFEGAKYWLTVGVSHRMSTKNDFSTLEVYHAACTYVILGYGGCTLCQPVGQQTCHHSRHAITELDTTDRQSDA